MNQNLNEGNKHQFETSTNALKAYKEKSPTNSQAQFCLTDYRSLAKLLFKTINDFFPFYAAEATTIIIISTNTKIVLFLALMVVGLVFSNVHFSA